MKKILLTGVVLILLIILAVDFYIDHNRTKNNSNNLQATATIPTTSPADAANVAPVNDMDVASPVVVERTTVTTTKTTKHKSRHARAARVDDVQEVVMNTPPPVMDFWGEENPAPVIQAEVTNQYTGNVPKDVVKIKTTVVTQKRRTVHVGPEIGIMQNTFYNIHDQSEVQLGFHAGGIVDIRLSDHIALQPALRYANKGMLTENVMTNESMEIDTRRKLTLHYVEMPVNFVVKFGDRENVRIIAGVGPYISYLVKAQEKYETRTTLMNTPSADANNPAARTTQIPSSGQSSGRGDLVQGQANVPIGNDNGAGSMRQLDWGANGFVGCEAPGGFFAKVGSGVGLRNVQSNADGSYSGKNLNFFVSIGYLIGNKK